MVRQRRKTRRRQWHENKVCCWFDAIAFDSGVDERVEDIIQGRDEVIQYIARYFVHFRLRRLEHREVGGIKYVYWLPLIQYILRSSLYRKLQDTI